MESNRGNQKEKEAQRAEVKRQEAMRRLRLVDTPESQVSTLSVVDQYDRLRYLRELEGLQHVNRMAASRPVSEPAKQEAAKKNYKDYGWD